VSIVDGLMHVTHVILVVRNDVEDDRMVELILKPSFILIEEKMIL
jgi:hypothetical protein